MATKREIAIRRRLVADFPFYAANCLKIRTKAGEIEALILNPAQLYIHRQLEEQKKRIGYVRALILKGRQQGVSTYVGGRFYHQTANRRGVRSLIMAHLGDASDNLFRMTDRYHKNVPEAVRPITKYSSKKELVFGRLDSSFSVATAGSGQAGRSDTVQLLHGSEVGFWKNAEDLAAGVMQTVPNAPGTEVILESTANGIGNFFHSKWQEAERGESDFIAIFVPWYWQDEYRAAVTDGFILTDDELDYMDLYGLTPEQMVWRRAKIKELGDELLFRQEYPASAAEAFQVTGMESFIPAAAVARARQHVIAEAVGPVVAGVDPARFGDDSTCIVLRQGRKIIKYQRHNKLDTMEVAGRCKRLLDRHKPRVDKMFIDVGGLGAGVVDRLNEMGYGERIAAVNFGSKAIAKNRYFNKRAEMWGLSKNWLMDEDMPVDIPDEDDLHADAIAPGYGYDSLGRVQLESKDDIRKRGMHSPDGWDAIALTFAYPVRRAAVRQQVATTGSSTFIKQPSLGSGRQAEAD